MITPSSLSKIRLLDDNIYHCTYERLSTKELTKMNWPKTTFSGKNCREGTVCRTWNLNRKSANRSRLYLPRRRELDRVVYSTHP